MSNAKTAAVPEKEVVGILLEIIAVASDMANKINQLSSQSKGGNQNGRE